MKTKKSIIATAVVVVIAFVSVPAFSQKSEHFVPERPVKNVPERPMGARPGGGSLLGDIKKNQQEKDHEQNTVQNDFPKPKLSPNSDKGGSTGNTGNSPHVYRDRTGTSADRH